MKPLLQLALPALGLGAPVAQAGLVAHFPFDTGFADASGNGNHLVAGQGTPAITADATERAFGAGALDLQSTTADEEYLNFPGPLTFAAGEAWSVVFWARHRPGSDPRSGMVIGDRTNSGDFIWIPRDGAVDGLRFRNSAGANADYNDGVQPDGEYHHWAVVADGTGGVEVFYDSSSLGTRPIATTFTVTSVGQAFNQTTQSMDGQIDELYLYDEAIDGATVEELFLRNDLEPPPPDPGPAQRVRVFLLAGQSNADGRGDPAGLPASPVDLRAPQGDVDFYEGAAGPLRRLQPDATFGPEITLGRNLADFTAGAPEARIAILKHARGGTDLKNQWRGGGDGSTSGDGPEYVTLQTTVANGLAALAKAHPGAEIEIEGIVWVQGERDARQGYHAEYEANLAAFIDDVRQTFGAGLPFVVVRLSSGQTDLPPDRLAAVRDAQTAVAAADPAVDLIDSDPFSLLPDALHFDALGQQQIGDASAIALASRFPLGKTAVRKGAEGGLEIALAEPLARFHYTLQSNDTLSADSWGDVETKTASGAMVEFTFSPPATAPRQFLRLERTAP